MKKYSFLDKILFPSTYLNVDKLRSKINGKTILITGASYGVGEALAYLLADFNVNLILVARTEEKLFHMKKEIESKTARVSVFPADLRNKEELEKLTSFLLQLTGGIDIFVSNAGKSIRRSITESLDRFHDFSRTMAINYFAPVHLLLSLIPILKKNNGQIINISTVNALLIPFPYWAAYQASKTAFDTWLRSAAPELNTMGIRTASIYLPLVRTRMIAPTPAYENFPAMSPDHVAKIVCRTMYTQKRSFKPWWIIFGQAASLAFRGIYELVIPYIIKKGVKDNENI